MKNHIRTLLIAIMIMTGMTLTAQHNAQPKFEYRAVWLTTIENLDWPKSAACDKEGFAR